MAAKGTVTVKILGDNKDLSRALGDSESKLGKFAGSAGKLFKAGTTTVVALGTAALIAGPKILEAGAKLEALGIKSATVFGDSLGDVEKWAEGVAGSMGLTNAELTGAAAGLGDLLKPMGFTSKEAANMSTEMLDLSGALSAWSGGQQDATEVADILAKAMLGETDGLKGLGISISAAEIEARLLAKGQKELTGTALAQAKALATQELIMEKSTDAQAAWTDGSMDSIKAQNESKASIGQLKEAFVTGLYPAIQAVVPVLTSAATWLGDHLPAAFAIARSAGQAVTAWFEENWPKIQTAIQPVVEWMQTVAVPAIQAVGGFIVTTFGEIKAWVDANWPAIQETISGVVEAIRVIVDVTTQAITAIWETHGERIMSYITATWDTIKTVIDAAINVVRGVINTVTSLIRGDWDGVWNGIKTALSGVWEGIKAIVKLAIQAVKLSITLQLDAIKVAWNAVWGGIASFVSDKWNAIKGYVSAGVDALVGFVGGIPGRISSKVSGAFDAIWTNFKGVINRVIDAWNNLSLPGFTIGGWDPPGPGPSFPSITIPSVGTPNIPRLASGGLAFAPMLAMVGDNMNARRDPEVIAPGSMIAGIVRSELDRDRSSGAQIIVLPVQTMDKFDPNDPIAVRRFVEAQQRLERLTA